MSLVPDETLALVGQEIMRTSGVAVLREGQRYAAAVRDANPLYHDDAYARRYGYRGAILPSLFLQYLVMGAYRLDELRKDGGAATGDAAGIPLPDCPRIMAGGVDWRFHLPVYDGDVVEHTRTLAGIEEKRGRSGSFVLLTSRNTYRRQDGELIAESTSRLIARPAG
ncbi:MaoC family dehydratase N-terminal domain-containing protein [Dactylosporangium sp. NPDC000555]|uniref:MaoC family dehydratase n=1 Tax=Dactylosporangium sp. NPDC000555 TaxID=3154260 RepID=UPI003316FFB8